MNLVSDSGNIALKFVALQDQEKDQEKTWYWASYTVLALRLMLLAQFYAIRSDINEDITAKELIEDVFQQPHEVVKKFRTELRYYNAQIRKWELRRVLPTGWRENSDATAYKTWSRDFGKESDAETCWGPFVRVIGSELRYQSHRMQVRQLWSEVWRFAFRPTDRDRLEARLVQQRWSEEWPIPPAIIQMPVRFLQALLLWLFKVIGFGLKPLRFAYTVIFTILLFSGLYFIDDTASRCKDVTKSLPSYWQEIYYAIGNLTSLGASPGPCGPLTNVLISIETLMGYFLLSLLAAMLVAWITDR